MSKRHRVSAIYQAALAELRDRYPDEFTEIYERRIKEHGIVTVTEVRNKRRDAMAEFAEKFYEEHQRGPMAYELATALNIPRRTAEADLILLCEQGDWHHLGGRGRGTKGYMPVATGWPGSYL